MRVADRNLKAAALNAAAKLLRDAKRRLLRFSSAAAESGRRIRGGIRRGRAEARDAVQQAYAGGVKTGRAFERWRLHTWQRASIELSVRRQLRRSARGDAPIIVGPWLGEVGYEALYWVPFVRWFADYYRIDHRRLVVVSRGGVRGWYSDITDQYVELFDLVTPAEFRAASEQRAVSGDQKQLTPGALDQILVERVRQVVGNQAAVCHPSAMFRLLRRFWIGSESMQYVLDHTKYRLIPADASTVCPPLPSSFIAVKFYSGRALPAGANTQAALGLLLERVRRGRPVVVLDTGLQADEHQDFEPFGLPDVRPLSEWMTPQNNLAVQTEVIRRAELFVGTCGSLAWLAPMVGTETLAVYADDHLLAPHLYAASQVYPRMGAAPFRTVDVRLIGTLGLERLQQVR